MVWKFPLLPLLLLSISAISLAQNLISCPTGRYSNCYNLPETGKCCFGHSEEPEVHVNDVALLLYDGGLQQFAANTRIEHCVFLIVHDYVSQASATWITNLAHSIRNIGKCIVQSKVHAQAGKSLQADAMRREHVLYNPAMPYRKVEPTIIIVDWAGPAMTLYQTAAGATLAVGRILAEKLSMHRQFIMKRPNIHCIGEGLGAHICGIAGSNYALGEFMRISGLDPSRPLFEPSDDGYDVPFDDRLDSSDAKFVDIIHTTSDLGFIGPIGHVDFYVNGVNGKTNVSDIQSQCADAFDGDRSHLCSHRRAREVFQSSFQRQCYFRTCATNGTNDNERCHVGWSAYRCKNQGEYCGLVMMDGGGFAQCYYDATLKLPVPRPPVVDQLVRKAPSIPQHPPDIVSLQPVEEPVTTTTTEAATTKKPQEISMPPHMFRVFPQDPSSSSTVSTMVSEETTEESTTTTISTTTSPTETSTTKTVEDMINKLETKPFYAVSLFTDAGGNCAGNTMITLQGLTLEQCAKTCLDTLGCAGFSIERLHTGPVFTCMIKSLGCLRPNPEGDFRFYRREM